jgi:cyclic pyranopterin phosphate synthase
MLVDSFGRRMETLRLSVTDRCNFRCRYCMPPEGLPWIPTDTYLSFDDIETVARAFLELGGSKLRITGGEPLLREDLPDLVRRLHQLPGLQSLGITTNASHLKDCAQDLWNAGLRRLNISIDSLNPCKFEWISLSNSFARVWEGLHAALDLGFQIKINTVVLKGITEREVCDLVALAIRHKMETRFIEFMPLCGTGWRPELGFPIQTVREWIESRWSLTEIPRGSDPAQSYSVQGTEARVGFIASLSESFCDRCSRIRMSANGIIRPCLFSKMGTDIKPYLIDATVLKEKLREIVWGKPAGHGALALDEWRGEDMPSIRSIGG